MDPAVATMLDCVEGHLSQIAREIGLLSSLGLRMAQTTGLHMSGISPNFNSSTNLDVACRNIALTPLSEFSAAEHLQMPPETLDPYPELHQGAAVAVLAGLSESRRL